MQFSVYFPVLLTLYGNVLCKYEEDKERPQFPGFFILPAIIVPTAYDSKPNEDTKIIFNADNKVFTLVELPKLTLNKDVTEDKNYFEANFRQALDRRNSLDFTAANKTNGNKRDVNSNDEISEGDNEVNTQETTIFDENITTDSFTTTEVQGIYNTSSEPDNNIKNPDYVLLPPYKNEDWKNFSMNANNSITKENGTKTGIPNLLNYAGYPSRNEPNSLIKGVYENALYNNTKIDQLSITTNSYTNELAQPPPQDDRWSNFSSLKKMIPPSNEFKPLAGLYYDGFLHRPVMKTTGFVPYNRNFLY